MRTYMIVLYLTQRPTVGQLRNIAKIIHQIKYSFSHTIVKHTSLIEPELFRKTKIRIFLCYSLKKYLSPIRYSILAAGHSQPREKQI